MFALNSSKCRKAASEAIPMSIHKYVIRVAERSQQSDNLKYDGYGEERMFGSLGNAARYLGQAAKLMIGVPDYDNYVAHIQLNHPDQTPMTYEEFFKDRQDARYGGKGGFKCC